MPRFRAASIFALALGLLVAGAAQAGESCDFQGEIIKLSDYVLANRTALGKLRQKRHGTISAYLKLRYGRLDETDATALMMPLVEAKAARASELMLAWAIPAYGTEAAIAIVGEKNAELDLLGASPSVPRAVILKDGVAAFAERLKGLDQKRRIAIESRVAPTLLDRFDTVKSELGRQAEAEGLVQLAAGLAAIQQDPEAWKEFAARVEDSQAVDAAVTTWQWAPALVGNPRIRQAGMQSGTRAEDRDRMHDVLIAAAQIPELDFLTSYLNQTGDVEATARVAGTIRTIADDKSRPAWTMDRAWITTYLELLTVTGKPDVVDNTLNLIGYNGTRHYEGSVRNALDWMIAADALTGYVTKTSEDREMPALLGKAMQADWRTWQAAAEAIRSGADLAPFRAEPKSLAIVAELLFAAGEEARLAAFLTGAEADAASVELAEDFANRMDRICYGYLNFPAEGLAIPHTPIFRFD